MPFYSNQPTIQIQPGHVGHFDPHGHMGPEHRKVLGLVTHVNEDKGEILVAPDRLLLASPAGCASDRTCTTEVSCKVENAFLIWGQ
jgi:hypothetical protein